MKENLERKPWETTEREPRETRESAEEGHRLAKITTKEEGVMPGPADCKVEAKQRRPPPYQGDREGKSAGRREDGRKRELGFSLSLTPSSELYEAILDGPPWIPRPLNHDPFGELFFLL